jgi:hypothetical protein
VVQYGHGLFGTRGEIRDLYLQSLADHFKWVMVAGDWYGMSQFDLLIAFKVLLAAPSNFATVPESTGQGFTNQVAMSCGAARVRRRLPVPAVVSPHVTSCLIAASDWRCSHAVYARPGRTVALSPRHLRTACKGDAQ